MDAQKQRRRHGLVSVFTSFVLGFCVLAAIWVYADTWNRVRAELDGKGDRVVNLAADLLAARISQYVHLAETLAGSEQFRNPADGSLDDARFQQATRAQRLSISTFDGIEGWLASQTALSTEPRLPALPLIWQLTRGLPLRSANGQYLARSRRVPANALLQSNPEIAHIAELDEGSRFVFLVPYNMQVKMATFRWPTSVENLASPNVAANPSIQRHTALAGGEDRHISIVVPVNRPGEQRLVAVTVPSAFLTSFLDAHRLQGSIVHPNQTLVASFGSDIQTVAHSATRLIRIGATTYEVRVSDQPTRVAWMSFPLGTLLVLLVVAFTAFNALNRQLLSWMAAYHRKLEDVERDFQTKARELAHDFQNTTFALRAFMSSILTKLEFEQQKRFTAVFTDLSSLTYQLSNTLAADAMDLAGLPGSIRGTPRHEATYLRGVLEGVAQLQSSVLGRPITVTVTGDSQEEPFVDINRPDLQRIVSNILTNAIEACKMIGTDSIAVSVSRRGAAVVIRFEDNGCGIAPADQFRIFELNYSTKGEERGKGLSVAKDLAKKANGDLFVEKSEVNFGTTMSLHLRFTASPQWFVNAIPIQTATTLVVVDDEEEVADYWEGVRNFVCEA